MTYASSAGTVPPRRHPAPASRSRLLFLFVWLTAGTMPLQGQERQWPPNSVDRPRPPVVQPGPTLPPQGPPSDAIVLLDGKSLDQWESAGGVARWKLENGHLEVAPGTGPITSRRQFGDIQLHLEWASPKPARGSGQNRGNSGVFLMGLYEVQILDSWQNETYADGQAAALYGQHPPRVNASRPPGEWQTYDIVFRRPRFNSDGSVQEPGRATVFHNGVLVHDGAAFQGRTVHNAEAKYSPHADLGPIMLQDHGEPVRFRNIWVRELIPRT